MIPNQPDQLNTPDEASSLYSGARRDLPTADSLQAQSVPADRSEGGKSTHLSEIAKTLIFAAIINGDSNAQINRALAQAGHLARGQALSQTTLTIYRKDPRARVEIARLSEEVLQAGHVALSDSLVVSVECFRACAAELLNSNATHREMSPKKRNSLVREMFLAINHLWRCLGREELLINTLRAMEMDEQDGAANQPGRLSPEERLEIENKIKRRLLEMLRVTLANHANPAALAALDAYQPVEPVQPDLEALRQ